MLPELRERVIAVALLLAMSVSMLGTASYAWLVLSRNPEVAGVSTTIAANGNLEIALVTGNEANQIEPPGDSEVGDSSAAEGQSVTAANITWGNLINLSDPSYGLQEMVLRPAQLNESSLNGSPLYGAVYSDDGRIVQLNSNFGYTTWTVSEEAGVDDYFGVTGNYGVRAISSTKSEAIGAPQKYEQLLSKADSTNLLAGSKYTNLIENDGYMSSLATMMGLFMTVNINQGQGQDDLTNPTVSRDDIRNLRDMYAVFLEAYQTEAEAMAAMADLQLFLKKATTDPNFDYTTFTSAYTAEDIRKSTKADLASQGIQISGLDTLKKDWATVQADYEKLCALAEASGDQKWVDTGIKNIVANLANINTCTLDGTPIGSIGASNATEYLSGSHEAVITNGILYNFEYMTGAKLRVEGLKVTAKVHRLGMTLPGTVTANISTSAPHAENLFSKDIAYANTMNSGFVGGKKVAQDTYGLAIDVWLRTNADGGYLTLEGNVLSETEQVRAMGKDPDNNEVELFTYTVTETLEDGSTSSYAMDVYQKVTTENGEEVTNWYNAETHSTVDVGEETPIPKMEEIETILGYEGENRVWTEKATISVDATTQGSGSCYVYYAETPEDMARSMKLLEAFNVAFVDGDGNLLATAIMDTDHYYADSGRVIVPMVLQNDSINLGEDYQGNVTYAITPMEKNTPTWITAIVYLDGTKLNNEDVLSAADIQGQLNIQFGTNASMNVIDNEKLENTIRSVSATVDRASFDYDTATSPMTTNVTVHVDGEQPNQVTAFFLRQVNANQGSRETEMVFTQDAGGNWVAPYTFKVPGTYVLRTVKLDGIDYELNPQNAPVVTVKGFTVESLSCDQTTTGHLTVMTAENSTTATLKLKFASDDVSKLPKKVQGRYLRDSDGSAVNVNFTYDPTTFLWSGSATFLNSGDYTLEYLVLDGEYAYLDEAMRQTATITLGMRVSVDTTSATKFQYLGDATPEENKLLKMQVKIMDNAGKELPGLNNAVLFYGRSGSSNKIMDTNLTWNGEHYYGELKTLEGGPGIWVFNNVTVGGNTLTYATISPTFTIQSPEPPEFASNQTVGYQYAPGNDAVMKMRFTNAGAASMSATIQNVDTKQTYSVEGLQTNELTVDGIEYQEWSFKIPKIDSNGTVNNDLGTQDGNWKLTEVKLWDVFDASGKEYTETAPLVFAEADFGENKTKVVATVYVTFAGDQSKTFGKSGDTVTGAFLQKYEGDDGVSGVNVDIKDFENKPLDGISDVTMTYVYGNDSNAYGGYTSSSVNNANADFTFTMDPDSTNTHFVQVGKQDMQYAGSYTPVLTFKAAGTTFRYSGSSKLNEGERALPANAPVFRVWSITPSVKITAAQYANKGGRNSTFTDTSTTVYYKEGTESSCGITYYNYTPADVTITLSGYGYASGAYLEFTTSNTDGKVHLYEESQKDDGTSTNKYTWTKDGACKRYVGYWESKTGSDDKTPAGTLTATVLKLTQGSSITCEVNIPDITINNPS